MLGVISLPKPHISPLYTSPLTSPFKGTTAVESFQFGEGKFLGWKLRGRGDHGKSYRVSDV